MSAKEETKSEPCGDAAGAPVIAFKKRSNKAKKKGTRRKRRRAVSSDEDEPTVVVQKKSRNQVNTFSTRGKTKAVEDVAIIKSTRSAAPMKYAGDATYTLEIDTAHDRDARALLEKHIDLVQGEDGAGDETKVYRGKAGYSTFVKKSKDKVGLNKVTGTLGPLRAPKNLRNTCRFDYQPDVCKDYKDTGYCGFGDTCIFLHDRGDYKQGWQIEREWQEKQKRKQNGEDSSDDEKYAIESDDEELPFACHICRGDFDNPIRTKCNHYFCLKCAMQRYKKTSTCAVCRAQTEGIFNSAPKLEERIKALAKEQAGSGGEDGDGDSDSSDIVGDVDEDATLADAAAVADAAVAKAQASDAGNGDDDGADVGGWEEVDSDG